MKITREDLICIIKEELELLQEEKKRKLDPNRPGMYQGETPAEFSAAVEREREEKASRKKDKKQRDDLRKAKRQATARAMGRLEEQEADEKTVKKAMKIKDNPKVQAIYDKLDDNPEVQAALQQFMAAELNEQFGPPKFDEPYSSEKYTELYNKLIDNLLDAGEFKTREDAVRVLRSSRDNVVAPSILDNNPRASERSKEIRMGRLAQYVSGEEKLSLPIVRSKDAFKTGSSDFRAGTMMGATVGAGATAMAAAGKLTATAAGTKLLAALGAAGLTVGGATMAATLGAMFLPIAIGYAIDKATK